MQNLCRQDSHGRNPYELSTGRVHVFCISKVCAAGGDLFQLLSLRATSPIFGNLRFWVLSNQIKKKKPLLPLVGKRGFFVVKERVKVHHQGVRQAEISSSRIVDYSSIVQRQKMF